jgi:hypothetical protein
MNLVDAKEALPIAQRLLKNLQQSVPPSGRAGSDARMALGDLYATLFAKIEGDALGPPLDWCFQLVIASGASVADFTRVRVLTEAEQPLTLGATLIRDCGINFCLIAIGQVISTMTFTSRSDVETVMQSLIQPFADAEEIAADSMDPATFQALIALHGAINNHLVKTAMPLPRMLTYQFFDTLPSLVLAHRLYGDAGRADEIVAENKIVHPAFCPNVGRALSS